MTSPPDRSRRSFITSMGLLSAAPLSAAAWRMTPNPSEPQTASRSRGLARRADDFLFTPGLVYLQTGSLGPTPSPVMEPGDRRVEGTGREPGLLRLRLPGDGDGGRPREGRRVRRLQEGRLLVTRSTTEGMNWVAQGLGLKAGDRVLTTDQDTRAAASAGTTWSANTVSPSTSSRSPPESTTRRPSSRGSPGR